MLLHPPDDVAFLRACGWTFIIGVAVCLGIMLSKVLF